MPKSQVSDWYDSVMADYTAIKESRVKSLRTGLPVMGSDADWHYRTESDYLKLAELARDDERNSLVVRSALRRLRNNVVRAGFQLDVNTGDIEIDKQLTAMWDDWASRPVDAASKFTFNQLEPLVFNAVIRDGDICVVPLKNGKLRIYESHRLRTPRNTSKSVIHGILVNEFREPVEYWFTKEDISAWKTVQRVNDITPIRAFDSAGNKNVFHLFFPDRLSQTRGISALAPCTDIVQSHNDLQWAALVKAKVSNAITFIRNRDASFDADPNADGLGSHTDLGPEGESRVLENWGPGSEIFGAIGETITGFSPSVPNSEFFQHAMLLLTFLSINLDLPLQMLLLDPTKTSFTGWRAALDEARKSYMQMQGNLSSQFHSETYRWKVRDFMKMDSTLGRASVAGDIDIFGHSWNPPAWDYIEPEKDAKADKVQQDNLLLSPRRIQARRGRNYELIVEEVVQDKALAIRRAQEEAEELNSELGLELTFRDLLPSEFLGESAVEPPPEPEPIETQVGVFDE